MRFRVLLLSALVTFGAQAQEAIVLGPVRALTLPLLADDANTVAHVVWRDGALVDLKSNAWTMAGTVPQIARTISMVAGAGPYSSTNKYTLGSGSDVLDFGGDFTAIFVVGSPGSVYASIFTDTTYPSAGWTVRSSAGGNLEFLTMNGAENNLATVNTFTAGANVVCVGRSAGTKYAKLNLGTLASIAGGGIVPATGAPAVLGNFPGFSQDWTVGIYQALWTSSAISDAVCIAAAQGVKARLGITAW